MATTRIMPLHVGKGRTESRAISDIIDYVANPKKTDNGRLITGYACDSRTADAEFLLAKRQYIAATGRVRGADDVIAYHVRQSFCPGEITPEEANRLGVEFAKRFTKGNHAFVVCTHIDKSHIHNHIIWSSVSLEYDRKFRNFWGSTKAVRQLSDTICIENGLSIVENPKPHGKSYNKWLGDQAKPSHRELHRVAIDNALSQSPADFEELLKLLQESGCEVSKRGKSYRLKLPGWEKAARMDSLGEGYRLEDLQAVLSGKKAHTSTKLLKEQLDSVRSMILVIGGLIGCIMAFAGLINFTNMIITNIITRRHEFATMQSIGMTGKQLRRLMVYEGIYYAVGADIIGGAVAAILAVTVLKSALNGPSMWFFTLNITLVPVMVIGVLYLLLAAVIPLIVLHFFNKGTVVERLRTSE